MKVLVYEPFPDGHRYEYIANILPALAELGVDVVVTSTAGGFQSEEFDLHLRPHAALFAQHVCADQVSTAGNHKLAADSLREFRRALNATGPDHAYFPMADGVTQLAGLKSLAGRLYDRNIQVEALHFRGGYGYRSHESTREKIQDRTYRFFTYRSPWTRYWHVDPWQLEALCADAPNFRERTLLLPDPVAPTLHIGRLAARRELGLEEAGTLVGCAGPMTRRKGTHLLIDAFAAALDDLPAATRLLLIGSFSPEMQQRVKAQDERVRARMIIIDRRLSDREMELAVPAMDVVCTPYPRSVGSSGIVLRAIAAGRPLVAADNYWMGRIVPALRAGLTCDVSDVAAIRNTLLAALRDAEGFRQSDAAKQYLSFQSIPNFRATWLSLLRQRLGLEEDPDRITWDTVASVFDAGRTGA